MIGAHALALKKVFAVLDTGAGLNFVAQEALPEEALNHLRREAVVPVQDANGRPLECIGTADLVVQLGNRVVK